MWVCCILDLSSYKHYGLFVQLLQNVLKKVVNDVSEIIESDEADIMTRMEVFSGVITEMDKMFAMLSVSTNFSFSHYVSAFRIWEELTHSL